MAEASSEDLIAENVVISAGLWLKSSLVKKKSWYSVKEEKAAVIPVETGIQRLENLPDTRIRGYDMQHFGKLSLLPRGAYCWSSVADNRPSKAIPSHPRR